MGSNNYREMRQLPHLQAKNRPKNETVVVPRTVHVSELSHAKMSVSKNYDRFRMVIDHGAVLEWVGFQWIMIRPAQPEDRRDFPQVVRGHA